MRQGTLSVVRIGFLLVGEASALAGDQARAVDQPDSLARLLHAALLLGGDGERDQIGNADTRTASAPEDERVLLQLQAAQRLCGDDACKHHGCGSLDVIVVRAALVAVLLQQAEGVGVAKVLCECAC